MIMNKKILIAIVTMFTLASCNKQLNIYPHNAASSDNLTPADAELFLTGMYNKVQNASGSAEAYVTFDLIGGDVVQARGTGGPIILINALLKPDQSITSTPWNGYFAALYQVNVLLESAQKLPDSQRKNEILGTTHYFRAYLYYQMVTRWGGVPILAQNTQAKVKRNTEAEVWQFIESELTGAINNAPAFTSINFVSKEAAQALMARVKLYEGKKTDAAALAEALINSGKFKLDTFDKIFRNLGNTEEIFAFKSLTAESKINISNYFYTYAMPQKGGYVYAPAADVLTLFDSSDKRKAISISVFGTDNIFNKYPSGQSGTDPLIISRLGELYLISAEAQGLAGLGRLNELRVFRGLTTINPATVTDYQNAILLERRKELMSEGFRWYDLVRLGQAKSVLGITDAQLKLPLPQNELTLNDQLTQNPGY